MKSQNRSFAKRRGGDILTVLTGMEISSCLQRHSMSFYVVLCHAFVSYIVPKHTPGFSECIGGWKVTVRTFVPKILLGEKEIQPRSRCAEVPASILHAVKVNESSIHYAHPVNTGWILISKACFTACWPIPGRAVCIQLLRFSHALAIHFISAPNADRNQPQTVSQGIK